MGSLSVLATVATIPTLVRVSHRLQTLLMQKAREAEMTIITAGFTPRPSSRSQAAEALSAIAAKLAGESEENAAVRIVSRLDIHADSSSSIRIAVFPDHFNEGEAFRVDARGGIKAQLVRGTDDAGTTQRKLHLYLGSLAVRKVEHRKVSATEEKQFRLPDWYSLLDASALRNIFKVPSTAVTMESDQTQGGNRVVHKFTMTYDGDLDIALNVSRLLLLECQSHVLMFQCTVCAFAKSGIPRLFVFREDGSSYCDQDRDYSATRS